MLRKPTVIRSRTIAGRRAARGEAAHAGDNSRLQLSPTSGDRPLAYQSELQNDQEYGTFEPFSSEFVAEATTTAYEATIPAQEQTSASQEPGGH